MSKTSWHYTTVNSNRPCLIIQIVMAQAFWKIHTNAIKARFLSFSRRHHNCLLWLHNETVNNKPSKVSVYTMASDKFKYVGYLIHLAPLSTLTSATVPWKWTDKCQQAFNNMKQAIARETLLTYPDFKKPFEIPTNASKVQLGAYISQDRKTCDPL
jgi:hypothetical protein